MKELNLERKPPPFPVAGGKTVQPNTYNTATDLKATNGKNVTLQKTEGTPQIDKYLRAMPPIKKLRYLFMPNGEGTTFQEALRNYGYVSKYTLAQEAFKDGKIEIDYLGADQRVRQIDAQTYQNWLDWLKKHPDDPTTFQQQFEQQHPGQSIQDFNKVCSSEPRDDFMIAHSLIDHGICPHARLAQARGGGWQTLDMSLAIDYTSAYILAFSPHLIDHS